MDRRFLLGVLIVAAIGMSAGFAGIDLPLAHWVRSSGIENARFFEWGLAALDTVSGMAFWIWAIGWIVIVAGALELFRRRDSRLGRALIVAGLVQFGALLTMIVAKDFFGRLRPFQVLSLPDGSPLWFAGGASFPSGHASFYFGLLLPLAAACPIRWQRVVLTAIPVYVVLARIDMAKHFLSDVSAGTLVASVLALIAAWLARHWLPAPRIAAS